MPTTPRPTIRIASKVAQRGYTVAQNVVVFDRRLTPQARLLYVQLWHWAWRDPDNFPDQDALGLDVGDVSDRQVRRYVAELESVWLVERVERGLGRAVEYVLHEPGPDYLERELRAPRTSKRPPGGGCGKPGGERGDDDSSSDIGVLASSDMGDRPARTHTSEPSLPEGSEDLQEQETSTTSRPRAITRDDHQRIADEASRSLARAEQRLEGIRS